MIVNAEEFQAMILNKKFLLLRQTTVNAEGFQAMILNKKIFLVRQTTVVR